MPIQAGSEEQYFCDTTSLTARLHTLSIHPHKQDNTVIMHLYLYNEQSRLLRHTTIDVETINLHMYRYNLLYM